MYYYDLWNLDSACAFSKLSAGQYTMTITGTNSAGSVTLAESRFTVDVNANPDPGGLTDEEYVVAFQVGDTTIESRVYSLTDTYGELPTVEEAGFQGWFRGDGTEVSPTSPVAASTTRCTPSSATSTPSPLRWTAPWCAHSSCPRAS